MELNVAVPLLVDAVIVLTVAEGIGLIIFHKLTGAGVAPKDYLLNLLAGLCLMAAVRSALLENGFAWVVVWLLLAGLAHTADLVKRWRRRVVTDTATSASARQPP